MYKHAISLTCPNADTTVKDLATLQSSCPSVTPGIDGNYFSIASAERLGTAQAVQFQSGDQRGAAYHWGSKLNESGQLLDGNNLINIGSENNPSYRPSNHSENNTSSTPQTGTTTQNTPGRTWVEHNSRSDIPRSYKGTNSSRGTAYDWYAATAETGKLDQSYLPTDSVCPSGWRLPRNMGTGSWYDLIKTTYQYISQAGLSSSGVRAIKKLPLSLGYSTYVQWHTGAVFDGSSASGKYWTTAQVNKFEIRYLYLDSSGYLYPQSNVDKANGISVRCVIR